MVANCILVVLPDQAAHPWGTLAGEALGPRERVRHLDPYWSMNLLKS